jgi:hypothetical protein
MRTIKQFAQFSNNAADSMRPPICAPCRHTYLALALGFPAAQSHDVDQMHCGREHPGPRPRRPGRNPHTRGPALRSDTAALLQCKVVKLRKVDARPWTGPVNRWRAQAIGHVRCNVCACDVCACRRGRVRSQPQAWWTAASRLQ